VNLCEMFGYKATFRRFPHRHECGHIWPPHNPDINSRNFFFWGGGGILAGGVLREKSHRFSELKEFIVYMCVQVLKTCAKTWSQTHSCVLRWP
jgi:hypothetical protein